MIAYISRRLGVLVVILFGSSFILYNLAAISGDPLGELRLSREPNAQQQIVALTRELNLDVPPPLRYFLWLRGILGVFVGNPDFGLTRTQQPVINEILVALPITLRLVTAATIIAIILGISIGIVTALRQYSRFDYVMTFVAQWLIGLSIAAGVFWSAIISGSRKRVLMIFAGAATANFALLSYLSITEWFANPSLGPIGVGVFSVGVAYGVTQLSTGIENKAALHSSLTMAAIALVIYYPVQWLFEQDGKIIIYPLLVITLFLVAGLVPLKFSRIDRGPIIRTSIISAFIMGLLIVIDQLMQTWKPYMESDAVYFRPIPTIGQVNALLEPGDFWMSLLDALVHMFLPTLALLLISFAGYVRFSRGTLLEVLNQDYIRTARAKGLTERTVIMRHAFRNTMIPIATIMVVDFASIIGGAIITERIFGWLGMGTLFNTAINAMDLNLLMGVFLLTGFLAVSANLIADLLYSALDPRIRAGAGGN